ncbi:MAG: VOC family protein [Actinomycetia bacterium]|nr:VOC family protein [Actinomycetes bacterium]
MTLQIDCLTIDCSDPQVLAEFWSQALGWQVVFADEHEIAISASSDGDGAIPDLLFLRVPDAKQVKNRLHLDLRPHDRDAEVARLESLGASGVAIGQKGDESWVVLADPEGNEFCVLRTRAGGYAKYEGDVGFPSGS